MQNEQKRGGTKTRATEHKKQTFPPEQTLVLKHVCPDRKALLETAITGGMPPQKLISAVDKHASVKGALLMYACYGSAAEAHTAQVG